MFAKRIHLGGIGLAIVLLLFMVVPLWLRGVDHPLAALATVDVCKYLNDDVLRRLPAPPVTVARGLPGQQDAGQSVCRAELPATAAGDAPAPMVWVMVTSERMLSAGGRPQRTDRFVDTWLAEAKFSGSEVEPVKGPWRRAAVLREASRPRKLDLLADDAGAVIWVSSQGIESAALIAFAEAVTRQLRVK